jgi:Beta-lactamase enzyme family
MPASLTDVLSPIAPELSKWAAVALVDGPPERPAFTWHYYKDAPDACDFWPASCVKLYTAVAALLRINALGGPALDATIAIERQTNGKWVLDTARAMRESLSEVFRRSSNEDYTLHLRICGLDWLNTEFFTAARGLAHSALMRGYVTNRPSVYLRDEPQRVTAYFPDGKRAQYEHKWSGKSYSEPLGASIIDAKTGNVTTARDLVECLRRIMFHEVLPPSERYPLTAADLEFLRHGGDGFTGLQTTGQESGPSAWKNGLDSVFPRAKFYHKTGLISNYALEIAYLDDSRDSGKRFLLAPAINAGHATKPKDGDSLIAEMSKAIGIWARGL